MIHISQLRKTLQAGKPFACKVWKKNGEIMHCQEVVCTSSNFRRNTANLLFVESRQVRKVTVMCIYELNDEEIYI